VARDTRRTPPGDPVAGLLARARERLRRGDPDGAEAALAEASARGGRGPDVRAAEGMLLLARGRLPDAFEAFRAALAADPRLAEAHHGMGLVLAAGGNTEQAVAALRRAVALRPDLADAHARLGTLLLRGKDAEGAVEHYRRWAELAPTEALARVQLGVALKRLGRLEEAERSFAEALRLDPDNPYAVAGQGDILLLRGAARAALDLVAPLVEAGTDVPDVATVFAQAAPRAGRGEEALALVERILRRDDLAPGPRRTLHHQAGRLYDRMEAYDRAFDHYRAGNALETLPHDPDAHTALVDRMIRVFDPARAARLPRARHAFRLPVFIVGMPRSGTTLVEQIIASHSAAHGAGELPHIANAAHRLPVLLRVGLPYPECVAEADADTLDGLAEQVHGRLRALAPAAERVTDKMPGNFLHLGLIALLFPAARVIHCVRDPMDTCLSCYFHDFDGAHPYASDLGFLGRYHRDYRRLMAHWKGVLDIPILDVRYEDLVDRPEPGMRELIDFCGLPWEDACLRFFETGREVHTASHDQVRRPIYRDAVGRWRRYEGHLAPLVAALGRENGAGTPGPGRKE
jgi:tetratricopeptide (TPR) repeat protein